MEELSPSKKSKYDEEIANGGGAIRGVVVLMKKNVVGVNDVAASVVDRFDELLGRKVALHLVGCPNVLDRDSASSAESYKGKLGKKAHLEDWITKITPLTSAATFNVTFEWSKDMGYPGAFTIANFHHSEFYLKTLTLDDVPGHGRVHFVCNSWIYHAERYNKDRIFFANNTYLPSQTPLPLLRYREEELENLRGTGTGKLEAWDRVYDYDIYNDLGDPDKGPEHVRQILGGSAEFPYPRRGRTGRPPASSDPRSESRIPLYNSLSIYVPRDERFSHLKMADFVAYALKSIFQFLAPEFMDLFDKTPDEFDSFEDVLQLYDDSNKVSNGGLLEKIRQTIPLETIKELLRSDGEKTFNFPLPQIIREDKDAWRSDEEFGREMLAGLNPVVIQRLQEFPPTSKLDPEIYGKQSSKISEKHIIDNLEGLTVTEAIENNKLFILDHHDSLMPYLRKINTTTAKTYATRTILFLKGDGTLKPLAIELSLPHPEGDCYGALSMVCTPEKDGVEATIWQLAKAFWNLLNAG